MAAPINPYAALPFIWITKSFEVAVNMMDEMSPLNSSSSAMASQKSADHQLGQLAAKPNDPKEAALQDVHQEMVEFTDDGPSFPLASPHGRIILIWMSALYFLGQHPHTTPPKSPNPFEVLFDCLVEFIDVMVEEDDWFVILPYHLSNYEDPKDLPPPIDHPDLVSNDIDEWLQYFPQVKLCARGSDLYMSVLVEFDKPFPKVMKALGPWFQKKKYGIWQLALQLEKPTLLGWLFFSTPLMDINLLKVAILEKVKGIPVGLW